jgi:hypothetical protein
MGRFASPEKRSINETGRSQGYDQKGLKEFCSSAFVISPDPLSPTPSTSSAMKTPENTARDPDEAQAANNTFQMEYSSD